MLCGGGGNGGGYFKHSDVLHMYERVLSNEKHDSKKQKLVSKYVDADIGDDSANCRNAYTRTLMDFSIPY